MGSSIKIQSTASFVSGFFVFKALAKKMLKLRMFTCAVLKYKAGTDLSRLGPTTPPALDYRCARGCDSGVAEQRRSFMQHKHQVARHETRGLCHVSSDSGLGDLPSTSPRCMLGEPDFALLQSGGISSSLRYLAGGHQPLIPGL